MLHYSMQSNQRFKRPKDATLAPLVRDNPHVTASLRVAVMPRSSILELWVFIKGGVLGRTPLVFHYSMPLRGILEPRFPRKEGS